MRAYKFQKTWIDLDHVLTISDVRFVDMMGHGGWFVEFEVQMMFMNVPVLFRRALEHEGEIRFKNKIHMVKLTKGGWYDNPSSFDDQQEILAVANLQKEVDELVTAWKS
jgi:hypothetical protein